MKYDIEPIVVRQSLRGFVLVGRQGDLTRVRSSFDLDKADVDCGLRVFGMGTARDQVKTAVVLLDALNDTPLCFLVGDDGLDGDALDLGVVHHWGNGRRRRVRVRQYPSAAKVLYVAYRTLPLLRKFVPARLQPVIEIAQLVFGDLDPTVKPSLAWSPIPFAR